MSRLGKMTPNTPRLDMADVALRDAVLASNFHLRAVVLADGDNIECSQPSVAVRFTSGISPLALGVAVVFAPCADCEMGWIDTSGLVAGVHENKIIGDWADKSFVSETMSAHLALSWCQEDAVSVLVSCAFPNPAIAGFINSCPEGFSLGALPYWRENAAPLTGNITIPATTTHGNATCAGVTNLLADGAIECRNALIATHHKSSFSEDPSITHPWGTH